MSEAEAPAMEAMLSPLQWRRALSGDLPPISLPQFNTGAGHAPENPLSRPHCEDLSVFSPQRAHCEERSWEHPTFWTREERAQQGRAVWLRHPFGGHISCHSPQIS